MDSVREEYWRRLADEWVFQLQLANNEWIYGSAYGPWLPPKPLKGIRALIDSGFGQS